MKTNDNQQNEVEKLEQTQTADTSAGSPNENVLRVNRQRMISLALFEAAMRFREGHYREDAEEYKANLTIESAKVLVSAGRGKKRSAEKTIEDMYIKYKGEQERFNKSVYTYIDNVTARMSQASQVGFDNYSTAYGLMADELQKTKKTRRLLTVVQMYNNGDFDEMFDKIDADRKKEEG